MSVANWPATKPHIHSATFNQKAPSRPDPGQGRAATDSDTCANSHFMATPGHQSLLLPCIQAYRTVVIARYPLARRAHDGTFLSSLQWARPRRGSRTMDRRPRTVAHGTWHDVSLSPNHRHPPLRVCYSLPFPTRSQVESTASHDHLNVSIRPEFRAEEAAVEHWYRAYWKAKRLPA